MGRRAAWPFSMAVAVVCHSAGWAQDGGDGFETVARTFLDAHCVRCHQGTDEESRGLDLSAPVSAALLADSADDWDWLLERVEFQEMPPPGEAAPSAKEREAFVRWLRGALGAQEGGAEVALDAAARGRGGLPTVGLGRLTRSQYQHAVQDLLGIQIDASRYLPEDAVGHGFNHVATAQSLSEESFLGYLEAAEAVAERAVPIGPSRTQRILPGAMEGGAHARGTRFLWTRGAAKGRASIPRPGLYRIRAEVFGFQAGPDPCRATLSLDGEAALPGGSQEGLVPAEPAVFDVSAVREVPEIIEGEVRVQRAGDLFAAVRFENDYFAPATEDAPKQDRNFAVRWIEVEGPLDQGKRTPFMAAFGVGMPPTSDGVAPEFPEQVAELAALLWRVAEIDAGSQERLLSAPSSDAVGDRAGSSEPAFVLQRSLVRMLSSPRFLFRTESSSPGARPDGRGSTPLDGKSVATRLAALLWDSVPDQELLDGADELLRDGALRAVAQGMLEDDRSRRFARSFGDQWLQLVDVGSKRAQRSRFPSFSVGLRAAMLEETRRVIGASLRERRSVWEFIDGEETFVNATLAEHYGLDLAPEGQAPGAWWRTSVAETPRRGLLGHGSILFATSEATRTSPVRRGKWVLDVLLGSAPPPPPPGADNLPKPDEGAELASLRERLEVHREDPTCAACHARMDPIGFGLDLFDAIGAERGADAALDLHGAFPNGVEFTGPLELARVLRQEEQFLEALCKRVLVYALGRGLERADRGALEEIAGQLDPECPTLEDMLLATIMTDEFRRVAAPRAEPSTGDLTGDSTGKSTGEQEQ